MTFEAFNRDGASPRWPEFLPSGRPVTSDTMGIRGQSGMDGSNAVAASETPMTSFSSDKEALVDLLLSIHRGKTQLPDFQRGWVWDDEHIRALLASITLSFPIGAVMMLETG